jgi:hypothetical protein
MLSTVVVKTLIIALSMNPLKMILQAQNMSEKPNKMNRRVPDIHLIALIYTVKNTAICL